MFFPPLLWGNPPETVTANTRYWNRTRSTSFFAVMLQQKPIQLVNMGSSSHLVDKVEANDDFLKEMLSMMPVLNPYSFKMKIEVCLKLLVRDNGFLLCWVRTLTDRWNVQFFWIYTLISEDLSETVTIHGLAMNLCTPVRVTWWTHSQEFSLKLFTERVRKDLPF